MLNHAGALRSGGRRAVAKLLAGSMLAAGALLTVSAGEATARPESSQQAARGEASTICVTRVSKLRGKPDLRIVCGGSNAVRIGEVDSYETAINRASGALAVRVSTDGRIRVLLAFPDAAGRPFVQDLSRDLMRAAGRSADAGLENVSVDLKPFGSTMVIGVADRSKADSYARSRKGTLDLSGYLALSKRILPTTPTQSAELGSANQQVAQ